MFHPLGAIVLAGAGLLGFVAGYRWDSARRRADRPAARDELAAA